MNNNIQYSTANAMKTAGLNALLHSVPFRFVSCPAQIVKTMLCMRSHVSINSFYMFDPNPNTITAFDSKRITIFFIFIRSPCIRVAFPLSLSRSQMQCSSRHRLQVLVTKVYCSRMPISALKVTTHNSMYTFKRKCTHTHIDCCASKPAISTDTKRRRSVSHRYPYSFIYLSVCFDMKRHFFIPYSLLFVQYFAHHGFPSSYTKKKPHICAK